MTVRSGRAENTNTRNSTASVETKVSMSSQNQRTTKIFSLTRFNGSTQRRSLSSMVPDGPKRLRKHLVSLGKNWSMGLTETKSVMSAGKRGVCVNAATAAP